MSYISIPCRYTGSFCKIKEVSRHIAFEIESGNFLESVHNFGLFFSKTFMVTNK